MAFSGMINLKSGQLTLRGQFDAYKRGQLERNIQNMILSSAKQGEYIIHQNPLSILSSGQWMIF
jgi:hypothetical protein